MLSHLELPVIKNKQQAIKGYKVSNNLVNILRSTYEATDRLSTRRENCTLTMFQAKPFKSQNKMRLHNNPA